MGITKGLCIFGMFAVVVAGPAWANSKTLIDDDDTPGPLDIVYVRHGHSAGKPANLKVLLGTYETWDSSAIPGPGGKKWVAFEFNTDKDRGLERCLFITFNGKKLKARMYGPRCGGDPAFPQLKPIDKLPATRPDQHSVKVVFSRELLGAGSEKYKWRGNTSYEDPNSAECPTPEPHVDGGYGGCSDFTNWSTHEG